MFGPAKIEKRNGRANEKRNGPAKIEKRKPEEGKGWHTPRVRESVYGSWDPHIDPRGEGTSENGT